jgi:hypothetical protein
VSTVVGFSGLQTLSRVNSVAWIGSMRSVAMIHVLTLCIQLVKLTTALMFLHYEHLAKLRCMQSMHHPSGYVESMFLGTNNWAVCAINSTLLSHEAMSALQ